MQGSRFAQSLMESANIAGVYETRLWRRCRLINLLQGITFDDEQTLVLAALNLQHDSMVLDVGCGTGIYTRVAAKSVETGLVIGVDLSSQMLCQARKLMDRDRLANMALVRADGLRLPIASDSLQAGICCGALHLFDDVDGALREMHRVLKANGRLAIATYRRRPGRVAEAFSRLRLKATGMHAFLPAELSQNLIDVGFDDIDIHHSKGIWLVMSATRC